MQRIQKLNLISRYENITPTKPVNRGILNFAGNASDEVIMSSSNKNASEPTENSNVINQTIKERTSNPEISKTLAGALIYLDDTQIRNRSGKRNCAYDSSTGDGSKGTILINLPGKKSVYLPIPGKKIQNEEGEWASFIHGGKIIFGVEKGKLPVGIQDSNLFMTAFTSYPLYLFEEKLSPEEKHIIKDMCRMAKDNIEVFKRGDAFNF